MTRDDELVLAWGCTDAVSLCQALWALHENDAASIGFGHLHEAQQLRDMLARQWGTARQMDLHDVDHLITDVHEFFVDNYEEIHAMLQRKGFR